MLPAVHDSAPYGIRCFSCLSCLECSELQAKNPAFHVGSRLVISKRYTSTLQSLRGTLHYLGTLAPSADQSSRGCRFRPAVIASSARPFVCRVSA